MSGIGLALRGICATVMPGQGSSAATSGGIPLAGVTSCIDRATGSVVQTGEQVCTLSKGARPRAEAAMAPGSGVVFWVNPERPLARIRARNSHGRPGATGLYPAACDAGSLCRVVPTG